MIRNKNDVNLMELLGREVRQISSKVQRIVE